MTGTWWVFCAFQWGRGVPNLLAMDSSIRQGWMRLGFFRVFASGFFSQDRWFFPRFEVRCWTNGSFMICLFLLRKIACRIWQWWCLFDILLRGDPFCSFGIFAAATASQRRWPLLLAVCLITDFCDLFFDLGCEIHILGQFCNFGYVYMRQLICDNVGILVILFHVQICNFVLLWNKIMNFFRGKKNTIILLLSYILYFYY